MKGEGSVTLAERIRSFLPRTRSEGGTVVHNEGEKDRRVRRTLEWFVQERHALGFHSPAQEGDEGGGTCNAR